MSDESSWVTPEVVATLPELAGCRIGHSYRVGDAAYVVEESYEPRVWFRLPSADTAKFGDVIKRSATVRYELGHLKGAPTWIRKVTSMSELVIPTGPPLAYSNLPDPMHLSCGHARMSGSKTFVVEADPATGIKRWLTVNAATHAPVGARLSVQNGLDYECVPVDGSHAWKRIVVSAGTRVVPIVTRDHLDARQYAVGAAFIRPAGTEITVVAMTVGGCRTWHHLPLPETLPVGHTVNMDGGVSYTVEKTHAEPFWVRRAIATDQSIVVASPATARIYPPIDMDRFESQQRVLDRIAHTVPHAVSDAEIKPSKAYTLPDLASVRVGYATEIPSGIFVAERIPSSSGLTWCGLPKFSDVCPGDYHHVENARVYYQLVLDASGNKLWRRYAPEEPMTAKIDTTSVSERIVSTLKVDATDAAWRTAGSQLTKFSRDALSALLVRHLAPDDAGGMRTRLSDFFRTEIGDAMISALIGSTLTVTPIPGVAGEVTDRLAREMRVRSLASGSDLLAEVIMGPLREMMKSGILGEALAALPVPAIAAPAEAVDAAPVTRIGVGAWTTPNE